MSGLQILTGDCRAILPTLEAGSVQCCVTSPPYWGLRDYGTAQWEGGDAECDHKRFNGYPSGLEGSKESTYNGKFEKLVCGKCGARRIDSQLGLEATPEGYIANMVAVFREVKRVLRDDGTLWLNLGDSYASSGTNGYQRLDELGERLGCGGGHKHSAQLCGRAPTPPGLKPKDLCMMPARVAMALQADGWYLRSDIIWHKPNPMPESVTDRPTKAHEYLFLLAKQERYFYDAEAIREIGSDSLPWGKRDNVGQYHDGDYIPTNGSLGIPSAGNRRNKRTVWTIATQPYSEAHFATFPEEIPKLCILAGSKPGDTILDPFAGSGTVGKVALELGRRAILIELNPAYIELTQDRTFVTPGFF
jgi:DNA modification methylase